MTGSDAFQNWLERGHGRQVEPPPTRLEQAAPGWARFVGGLTRQYEFLAQGGKYQGVRAALDAIQRATRSGEMQELFNLQDAYGGLSAEQRHKVDLAFTARDMDEEVRRQFSEIEQREQVKADGRRERAVERYTRQREEKVAREAAVAKEQARSLEARGRERGAEFAARMKALEEKADGAKDSINGLLGEIERAKEAGKPTTALRAKLPAANAVLSDIEGRIKQETRRAERYADALAKAKDKAAERLEDLKSPNPERMAEFDRRHGERLKKHDAALVERIKRKQENAPILKAMEQDGLALADVERAVADAAAHDAVDPKLKAAIAKDKALEKAVVDERKALLMDLFGFADEFTREEYLHHEMLFEAAKQDALGGGKRLGVKGVLNAFYTMQRKGTSLRYNTNTMEAKQRVYARMIADNTRLRALKAIKAHDIGPEIVARALKDAQAEGGLKPGDTLKLDGYIPDTHVRFSPDKGTDLTQFWDAQARYVERLTAANFDRLGLTPGQNKQDLYLTHLQDWIIPKELAETLRSVVKPYDPTHEAFINRILRGLTGFWKRSRLHWPHSVARYELGNFGDDTASAFKFTPVRRHPNLIRLFSTRAWPEVWGNLFGRRQPSPEYREFLLRAGTDSQQLHAELGIADLEGTARQRLERALAEPNLWKKVIGGTWQAGHEFSNWYLNGVMRFDGARERLWRYTLFLDNLDMMTKSADGRPSHYGASIPDEVLAYDNLYDRAYHMSNDTLIAYDKTTAMGRYVADHFWPFYRFQEGNHRRHYRYLANQTRGVPENARLGAGVAAKLGLAAKATPFALARLGGFAVKMASIEAALVAYNYSMYPEAMDALDEKDRQKPLLITGWDPRTGEVQYIRNLGALPDFYALFGLMDNARIGRQWLNGEISSWDALARVHEKNVETVSGMFGPWRNLVLLAKGLQTTRGGKVIPVRDPVDNLLGEALGPWAQRGYRELNDIPQKKFETGKLFLSATDVDEAAYHHTLDRLGDFKRKMELGSAAGGGPYSEKQNALYWHRQAKRYGDSALAAKYGALYAALNGPNPEGYGRLVEAMSPVGRLNMLQVEKWLGTLDMREKRGTIRAMQHWADLFATTYDVRAEIESGLKGASKEALAKSPLLTRDPKSLLKILDAKERLPEATRKQVDSDLASLLTVLHGLILGDIQIEALEKGGITDTLLSSPDAIDRQIERGLKKSGVE